MQSPTPFIEENPFQLRKIKSSSLLFGHSRNFKNVETFNLSPGYRLSRSAGKIYVSIQTKDPPPPPKPAPRETLLNDLREQVTLLSTYLEEERLRHAGTKKRAALDLTTLERNLREAFAQEMLQTKQSHEEEKKLVEARNAGRLKQLESELEGKMDKMQTEYRMLQASFKIYQSTLQEEMEDEMKIRRAELDWEKKQSVEKALGECKSKMEDIFSREREEMRGEFRKNMNEMMKAHREEIEKLSDQSKFDKNIADLIKRSERLTAAEEEIERMKSDLKENEITRRLVTTDLEDTKRKLSKLELQFDGKVREVEDHHRSFIDSLKQQKADVTRRLVRSCEELQVEKIAREKAEKYRQEAAIFTLEKKLLELSSGQYQSVSRVGKVETKPASTDTLSKESNTKTSPKLLRVLKDNQDWQKNKSSDYESEVSHLHDVIHEKTDKVSHLIDDITTILSGVEAGRLPKVLSDMLVDLTESETRSKMALNLDSSIMLSSALDQRGPRKAASIDRSSKSSKDGIAAAKRKQLKRGSKSRFHQNQIESGLEIDHAKASGVEYSVSTLSASSRIEANASFMDSKKSLYGEDQKEPFEEIHGRVSPLSADQSSTTGSLYSRMPSDFSKSPDDHDRTGGAAKDLLHGETGTQTGKSHKHIGFASDPAFNKKQKRPMGLSKAYTQPNMEFVEATDVIPGRWRGTFLCRDMNGRPPIIFEVEEYKAMNATSPDPSKIAKKLPVHSSKMSAANVGPTKPKGRRTIISRSPSPTPDKSSK